jgi:serine/threonine protein phosphatase PrpC
MTIIDETDKISELIHQIFLDAVNLNLQHNLQLNLRRYLHAVKIAISKNIPLNINSENISFLNYIINILQIKKRSISNSNHFDEYSTKQLQHIANEIHISFSDIQDKDVRSNLIRLKEKTACCDQDDICSLIPLCIESLLKLDKYDFLLNVPKFNDTDKKINPNININSRNSADKILIDQTKSPRQNVGESIDPHKNSNIPKNIGSNKNNSNLQNKRYTQNIDPSNLDEIVKSQIYSIFSKDVPVILFEVSPSNTFSINELFLNIDKIFYPFDSIKYSTIKSLTFDIEIKKSQYFTLKRVDANDYLKKTIGIDVKMFQKLVSSTTYQTCVRFSSNKNTKEYLKNDPLQIIVFFSGNFKHKIYYKKLSSSDIDNVKPKDMWNDFEVKDDEGYPTPNKVSTCIKLEDIDKILVAASVRGRSHAHEGKPRDDNYFQNCDNPLGWKVVAVCDGAGSARFSRKGSQLASETSVNKFLELVKSNNYNQYLYDYEPHLIKWKDKSVQKKVSSESASSLANDPTLKEILRIKQNLCNLIYATVRESYASIHREVTSFNKDTDRLRKLNIKKQVSINEFNTTLLFTAFKKFSFGYFFISFSIGDGASVIFEPNKKTGIKLLGIPDHGAYEGQTLFLTMLSEITPEKVKKRTVFTLADDFEAVIMATDGISDPFFQSDDQFMSHKSWNDFYRHILKNGDSSIPANHHLFVKGTSTKTLEDSLLNWCNFYKSGFHDDRTILIIK